MMQSTSSLKSAVRAATVAVVLSAIVAPAAGYASTLRLPASTHALMGGKEKSVRFTLRNQSGASIDLRAGDKTMTLAAGQSMDLKLPIGTRIVTTGKTDKREAGATICEVSAATADTTIVLN